MKAIIRKLQDGRIVEYSVNVHITELYNLAVTCNLDGEVLYPVRDGKRERPVEISL